MLKGCPGAVRFKEPVPEDIACPHCGTELEIWSDEIMVLCPNCRTWVPKARGASCIDWCPLARACIGAEKYERLRQGGLGYELAAATAPQGSPGKPAQGDGP